VLQTPVFLRWNSNLVREPYFDAAYLQAAFDIGMDHPFNDHLSDICRGKSSFGFAPQKGSAIMFDSMFRGGNTPNKRT
jgi:hypothetical protein